MGTQSRTNPPRRIGGILRVACLLVLATVATAQSASIPLILPTSVAFDSSGNLFFAEAGSHLIRRLTPAGVLSIVAGTGTQGFAGDGGAATAALLDSPSAVAVDSAGNLFVADSHNHRICRVDALSGFISSYAQAGLPTALAFDASGDLVYADAAVNKILRVDATTGQTSVLAGNGTQGFSGDGGPAIAASIDTPSGVAFDSSGNFFLADAHNHRIRRIDAATGIISTVAGTGAVGFSGETGPASNARLDLPRGVTLDAAGDLYVADSQNHRIRRIDAVTGQITTVAGTGTQAFLGDGGAATAAALDSPRGITLTASGLPTLADSANNRVRQVDAAANIQTIAGTGVISPAPSATISTLTQTSLQTLTASVTSASGTPGGKVTLVDATTPVAVASLNSGVASFSTANLSTGSHTLTSTYAGSSSFLPSTSAPLIVTVGSTASANFTLASSGSAAITIPAGSQASFAFTVTPTGSALSSPIVLSVSGLPQGATATFTPTYIPPPSAPANFTLTIATPVSAELRERAGPGAILAVLFAPLLFRRRLRRCMSLVCVVLLAGCGDRVSNTGETSQPTVAYTIIVSATATSPTGATLLQTAQVTLTLD
jgi:sugar lactone lactonase YvrE